MRVRLRTTEPARVHHPEVTEREVVFHGIRGIEPAQRVRDVTSHRPPRARVARQPQAPPDANDVRVERHDEPGRGHARPHAEIQRVAAHHPPQEQIEPLAGAAGRRAREEIAHAVALPLERTVCRGHVQLERSNRKAVERVRDVGGGWVVAFEEEPLDRARTVDHLLDDPQQRDDVRSANPAVHEPGERLPLSDGIERAHVGRRPIADDRQQPLDRLQDARHPAEGERRRAEADDLAIVGPLVAPDDLNRIGRRIGIVELGVEPVQGTFQQLVIESRGSNIFIRRIASDGNLQSVQSMSPLAGPAPSLRSVMIVGVRRVLLFILAGVAVLVLGTAVAAYFYLRQSLPATSGTIAVNGLSAPIDIIRDADAIPHIYAATKLDALFGLGYVHAQDRLWQMEFQRRIGFGRLSEILGAAALPQDKFLRTVGFGRAARSAWARLPAQTKQEIDAYVAGINAFLATHHGSALPPEFTLLRFEPEPWTGADVVVWQKMMAWDLSANYSFELLRHDIVGKVGRPGLADLMPPYPDRGLSITGTGRGVAGGSGRLVGQARRQGQGQPAPADPALAFALAVRVRRRAVHGRPHSERTAAWRTANRIDWLQQLGGGRHADRQRQAAPRQRSASCRAGAVDLVSRARVGWRLRRHRRDDSRHAGSRAGTQPLHRVGGHQRRRRRGGSLSREARPHRDASPNSAASRSRFSSSRRRSSSKGQPPVRIDVRVSRHGPLVSDAINAMNQASPERRALPPLEPLAFRWTALDPDDTTIVAMMRMSEARNWSDFTAALREFVVPSQNFVYADVDGHIGYYAPGRIPIRAAGDGTLPAEGWTGGSEWTGWVPFDELPHVYDPPEHLIVTANNRPAPRGLSLPARRRMGGTLPGAAYSRPASAADEAEAR